MRKDRGRSHASRSDVLERARYIADLYAEQQRHIAMHIATLLPLYVRNGSGDGKTEAIEADRVGPRRRQTTDHHFRACTLFDSSCVCVRR